jgi:hypothetical protein
VYTIVEDVVAVDGGEGTAYGVSLDRACEGRRAVRTILGRLNCFGGLVDWWLVLWMLV